MVGNQQTVTQVARLARPPVVERRSTGLGVGRVVLAVYSDATEFEPLDLSLVGTSPLSEVIAGLGACLSPRRSESAAIRPRCGQTWWSSCEGAGSVGANCLGVSPARCGLLAEIGLRSVPGPGMLR